jgi:hypothetical protein
LNPLHAALLAATALVFSVALSALEQPFIYFRF